MSYVNNDAFSLFGKRNVIYRLPRTEYINTNHFTIITKEIIKLEQQWHYIDRRNKTIDLRYSHIHFTGVIGWINYAAALNSDKYQWNICNTRSIGNVPLTNRCFDLVLIVFWYHANVGSIVALMFCWYLPHLNSGHRIIKSCVV